MPLSRYLGALAAGLGCFPFDNERSRPLSHSGCAPDVFGVCRRLVGGEAPAQQQCSTSVSSILTGCTSMHFGENQLSPLSIGISPRPTRHPSGLQSTPVRASMTCYGHFTLHMGSSSGFGSTIRDNDALFRLAFAVAPASHCLNRPRTVTRRIILQKARRQAVAEATSPFDCM